MEKETVSTGNRLIAEFMGYEFHKGLFIHKDAKTPIGNTIYPNELKYHTSWDWLMEVVEKIEDLRFQFVTYNSAHSCNVRISQGYIEIEGTTGQKTFRNCSVEKSKINALWLAVIDFIKWYEEMQPKNIYNTLPKH